MNGDAMYEYKHFIIDEQTGKAYLLGYHLELTKNEYGILCLLCRRCDGVTVDEIVCINPEREIARGSVKVHICNINKKAYRISKRKLILFDGGKYRLNEFM